MNARFSPLENETLLLLSGPDAMTFLQGQTSCDSRQLSPERALPGVYCTPQGRVVCDFLLLQLGHEQYGMRMRAGIVEHSAAVLGKYIIFSKAELSQGDAVWRTIGCWGEGASAALSEIFGEMPTEQYGSACGEEFVIVQLDRAATMFECHLLTAPAEQHLQQLAQAMEQASPVEWQHLEIQSGIARIEKETAEEFVPQSLNYDLTGHISFDKGCYTGQEVVARLHYRGTPKRRTHLAKYSSSEQAGPGTKLYGPDSEQSIGEVVNSATDGDMSLALISVAEKALDASLHLSGKDGPELKLESLPYSLQPSD